MNLWIPQDSKTLGSKEAVLYIQNGVTIYENRHQTSYQNGVLTVTTHHLFYEQSEKHTTVVLRLPLEMLTNDTSSICCKGASGFKNASIVVPLFTGASLKFYFLNGGMEHSFNALRRAVQQKAWLQTSRSRTTTNVTDKKSYRALGTLTPVQSSKSAASTLQSLMITKSSMEKEDIGSDVALSKSLLSVTDKAGIGGLMRVSAMSVPQLRDTLHDIDDVMKKYPSLVAKVRLLKEKQSGSEKISAEDETRIESVESILGFGEMVHEPSNILSRNKFYKDLAYELHLWMTHYKNKHVFGSKVIVSLIELFSLYNIARGIDLVAPADILVACRIMSKEDYSQYTLKQFTSGRLALQQKDNSLLLDRLVSVLGPFLYNPKNGNGTTVTEKYFIPSTTSFPTSSAVLLSINDTQLAASLQEDLAVAQDLLLECESNGYLCRSEGEFGFVTFYWNIFVF